MNAPVLLREPASAGVQVLRLNRPQRLNALTLELAQALLHAVREADADPQVRVLVLEGEGRAFCAGKDRDDPPTSEFVATLQQLAAALMGSGKPVLAAVQGWAVGAGLELLLNCDVVVAAHEAQFMLPEVNVGLLGTGGVLALLPRKIGLARAKGVLLLGQPFSAEEAHRWGLIWSVADDAAAEARRLAAQLAQADAAVLAQVKQGLHAENIGELAAVLERERAAHARLVPSARP